MNTQELREKYKDFRISLGLTLREASRILEIDARVLSEIEIGKLPPFVVDKTRTEKVQCRYCKKEMEVHPIISPPVLFPMYCCDDCSKLEDPMYKVWPEAGEDNEDGTGNS